MILHIPHSGIDTIGRNIEEYDINELTDWFTDELFEHENADRLVFPISRFVCDVERFPDKEEELFKMGQGICYTKGTRLNNIKVIDKENIIKDYYLPHHKKLNDTVRKTLTLIPKVIVVDCHSFTPKTNESAICIGTNLDTPQELINSIKDKIVQEGLSVSINFPFEGAIVPTDYVKDDRVIRIKIEVNKKLYLSYDYKKLATFKDIKKLLKDILNIISEYEISFDI